ncbi:MAG: RHS repeat-associated core domain-containing protein [Bryobacterales bacterium]|nr:RHS repeat-associated core domain-containing protein [Bryobacterales bacterium]
MTNQTGAVVSRHDYLPFGWELYSGLTGRTNGHGYLTSPEGVYTPTQRFTGKERDSETRLDYFGARYYSAGPGRFTSADAPFADQHTDDPQSWNLYAYVRNNPQKYVDPSGNVAETLWDIANIGLGLYSFVDNASQGNYVEAAWDAGGVAVDVVATAVPFVPGGAGAALKAARIANKVDNATDGVKAARNAEKAKDAAKASETAGIRYQVILPL